MRHSLFHIETRHGKAEPYRTVLRQSRKRARVQVARGVLSVLEKEMHLLLAE